MNSICLNTTTLLLLSVVGLKIEAKEKQRPKILVCIADDQSFPHAGAYGCK